MRAILLMVVLLFLAACSGPVIDTTTEQSTKASINTVRMSLPADDQAEFQKLVMGMMFADGLLSKTPAEIALKPLSGMDGPTALAALRAARDKREADAKNARRQELAVLEEKAKLRETDLAKLKKITLADIKLTESKSAYGDSYPLTATINNGLDVALAHIRFEYTLKSEGREVPWFQGKGTFVVSGGIEPGETVTEELATDGFGSLYGFLSLAKSREEHPDAVLVLNVTDGLDATLHSVVKAPELSRYEIARMEALRAEMAASK